MNDTFSETYSRYGDGKYNKETNTAFINFAFPDYMPPGIYELNKITMKDIAGNKTSVYFTDDPNDEPPQTIQIQTSNPDFDPPVLDINDITIKAEPTKPEAPNGETIVDITFKVKDNISGYHISVLRLRDPQGLTHHFYHYRADFFEMYFTGDPTIYQEYDKKIIVLPVGSVPGTWGLAEMRIEDKAGNRETYDFTEIVRFEITDSPSVATTDVNGDGEVNILDLVLVANAFGESNQKADVNGDGEVNILDLVAVANAFGE